MSKRLSKGIRKYIARQKALIRKTFSDPEKIEERIANLYQNFKSEN